MRWQSLVGALAACSAAYGCQIIAGIEDVPNATTAGGGDAGTDATSGGDASNGDAGASDGGGGNDGRSGGRWCAQQTNPAPTYCFDFDDPPLERGWDGVEANDGGVTLALDNTTSKSPPSSYAVTVPAVGAGGYAQGLLAKRVASVPFQTKVVFDVNPIQKEPGPDAYVVLFGITVGDYPDNWAVQLFYSADLLKFEEVVPTGGGNHDFKQVTLKTLPANVWTHVALDVVLSQPTPHVTITLDGVPVLENKPITPDFGTNGTTYRLGDTYSETGAGSSWRFDNVAFYLF